MTDIYDLITCNKCGVVLDRTSIKVLERKSGYYPSITYECPVCKERVVRDD